MPILTNLLGFVTSKMGLYLGMAAVMGGLLMMNECNKRKLAELREANMKATLEAKDRTIEAERDLRQYSKIDPLKISQTSSSALDRVSKAEVGKHDDLFNIVAKKEEPDATVSSNP